MLSSIRRRWLFAAAIIAVLIAGLVILTTRYRLSLPATRTAGPSATAPAAPADLQRLRDRYAAGIAALDAGDGPNAATILSSFDFGSRAVEEYRLYYLANARQLGGDDQGARATLARLWRRSPKLIYANDVAFHLADLYEAGGSWRQAGQVSSELARTTATPPVAAAARWKAARAKLAAGDLPGALYSGRNILVHHPASAEAVAATAFVRGILGLGKNDPIPMTASERLDRATSLNDNGAPAKALDELAVLERSAPQLRQAVLLQKGIALHRLRRYDESNKALESLTSGPFKYAIPALRHAARNYAAIAAAIDPNVKKTIKERKKVGTVKVKVGKGKKRRTVTRPRYQNVFRTVTLVDLAKKQKKEENDRLASERLRDLLQLKLDDDVLLETLNALIVRALEKKQDAYLQELIPRAVKLEPQTDPALQYFWDKAWAAWTRGDLATAKPLFRFIADTYTHPNVRRQATYWYARTIERQGAKDEAARLYQELADVPYADLYAGHAVAHGAKREERRGNPFEHGGPDWREIAEKEMPAGLRIAYELTALGSMRDAYLEIRGNRSRTNARFAEALMAEIHQTAGNEVLMYRSLRIAWPQLATVEQDSVPVYFLKMYYPIRYGDEIEEHASKNGLDPNLVRALILQESYYNPEAKSHVGATGLMQLMPATANDHARRLRIPFASSRLENPDVNIALGTYHLRMLLGLFDGSVPLAVASYNAGQGNVMKWRRAAPRKPMDEFLESIPFPETRNYVKRVTMLRATYRRLPL